MSADEFEGLLETLEILSDSELVLRLAEADEELAAGSGHSLDRLINQPQLGKPLVGPLEGHRSLRVGHLRIIYRIEPEGGAVFVLDIASRGRAYRDLP